MKFPERAIFELVNSFVSGRVYAARAPQNATAPYVIYQRIDGHAWRSINGPNGIAQAEIQVDTYAREYYEAKNLAGEIQDLLDGYRNTVLLGNDSPPDSIRIAGISYQNDIDIIDQTDTPLLHRVSAVYLVTFETE